MLVVGCGLGARAGIGAYRKWERARHRAASQIDADDHVKTQFYIDVRNGTHLAADVFRPASHGVVRPEPLPVVWSYTPYNRATRQEGRTIDELERSPWLRKLIRRGYVVAVVDVRGTGASSDVWTGPFAPEESTDTYDVTEWIARQPWCDGNVGMFGRSYPGINQFLAAAASPPHLKAIFPEMPMFDLYDFVYGGGAFRAEWAKTWSDSLLAMNTEVRVAPVNGETLLAHPSAGRIRDAFSLFQKLPERFSVDRESGEAVYVARSPSRYLDAVNASAVPTFIVSGWFDIFTADAFRWYEALSVPRMLVVGPWFHGQIGDWDIAGAHLDWYDAWLRGAKEGQTGVRYFMMATSADKQGWRQSAGWPPAGTRMVTRHLCGETYPVSNEGSLCSSPQAGASDRYVVDHAASSGPKSRWRNPLGSYGDMNANDARGLTYTSPPLDVDFVICGSGVARLSLRIDEPQVDIHLYLEDVDAAGHSHYVSEGFRRLRSTQRYEVGSMNDHVAPSSASNVDAFAGEVSIEFIPTCFLFAAGERIRVTLTGDDAGGTRAHEGPATVVVSRSLAEPSFLSLPTIPSTN
jgi:putative CocE/NonD family hydrolase